MIVAGIGIAGRCNRGGFTRGTDADTAHAGHIGDARDQGDAGVARFADNLGVPLIELSEADIADIPTRTVSPRIQARFGTGSLAEAAALRVAGRGAKLTTLRVASPNGMATAAIAEGIAP